MTGSMFAWNLVTQFTLKSKQQLFVTESPTKCVAISKSLALETIMRALFYSTTAAGATLTG